MIDLIVEFSTIKSNCSVIRSRWKDGADGSGDSFVDSSDYDVWRDHYGQQYLEPFFTAPASLQRVESGIGSSVVQGDSAGSAQAVDYAIIESGERSEPDESRIDIALAAYDSPTLWANRRVTRTATPAQSSPARIDLALLLLDRQGTSPQGEKPMPSIDRAGSERDTVDLAFALSVEHWGWKRDFPR